METLYAFRWQVALFLVGLTLSGAAVLLSKTNAPKETVEVLGDEDTSGTVIVEVSGAVKKPGVYELKEGARVDEALKLAEGLLQDADSNWVNQYVNRAAKIEDGQKLYIPKANEHSSIESDNNLAGESGANSSLPGTSSTRININKATQKELESIWGIGPVYAQKIIEQRPYSNVEELISKGVIKQNVYDKNKDILTVY